MARKTSDKLKFDFNIFFNNIRLMRAARGISAEELTIACGLTPAKRISDFETDRGIPRVAEVVAICKYFEQPIDKMLSQTAKITLDF